MPCASVVFGFGALLGLASGAVTTNLNGAHYDFTTIHDPPAVDVGLNDGAILDKSLWSGYVLSHIRMISQFANFTYELHLPSGAGPSCTPNATQSTWGKQFLCGEEDTLIHNITDAYWSNFYVTPARMTKGRGTIFTAPHLTNNGLNMLVKAGPQDYWYYTTKIFKPFTVELWIVTFLCWFFTAFVMWICEQITPYSGAALQKLARIEMIQKAQSKAELEQQLAIRENVKCGLFDPYHTGMHLASKAWLALTLQGVQSKSSSVESQGISDSGSIFTVVWCLFALVWVSAYTANLVNILTEVDLVVSVTSIADIVEQNLAICVTSGTAYAANLATMYPNIKQYGFKSSEELDQLNSLANGTCAGIVQSNIKLEAMQNGAIDLLQTDKQQYCVVDANAVLASSPNPTGFTDMAAGVASDEKELAQAITYWTTAFRTCDNATMAGDCFYGFGSGRNLVDVTTRHVQVARCSGSQSTVASYKLGVKHMMFPLCALSIWGFLILLYHRLKLHFRYAVPVGNEGADLMRECFEHGIWGERFREADSEGTLKLHKGDEKANHSEEDMEKKWIRNDSVWRHYENKVRDATELEELEKEKEWSCCRGILKNKKPHGELHYTNLKNKWSKIQNTVLVRNRERDTVVKALKGHLWTNNMEMFLLFSELLRLRTEHANKLHRRFLQEHQIDDQLDEAEFKEEHLERWLKRPRTIRMQLFKRWQEVEQCIKEVLRRAINEVYADEPMVEIAFSKKDGIEMRKDLEEIQSMMQEIGTSIGHVQCSQGVEDELVSVESECDSEARGAMGEALGMPQQAWQSAPPVHQQQVAQQQVVPQPQAIPGQPTTQIGANFCAGCGTPNRKRCIFCTGCGRKL